MPDRGTPRLRILHLEDNPTDAQFVEAMLQEEGFELEIRRTATQSEFQQALEAGPFDLIVSDFTLPSFNGMMALALARATRPEWPFIFFSGTIGEEAAVESLKNGATDYVLKHRPQKLVTAIQRALREVEDRRRRQETERALKEAEQRYRSIFNNAIEGICQTTPEGKFITANPALAEMLGYDSPADLMDQVEDLGTQVYAKPELRAELKRLLDQQGVVKGFACRARKKDGSEIWISINARAIVDAQGTLLCHDCSVADITERRTFQARIQEQAALLDEAQDAICVTDMTRRILYWNEGSERLYGWTASEVAGQSADSLLDLGETPLSAEMQTILRTKGRWEGELTQTTKDGRRVVVESRWTLVRDQEGEPKSILVIATDITEKKKAEAQFLRAQRIECVGVLAGGIAHDLNNILAPILMASELLQLRARDEDRRMIEIVKSSAERGSEMVKQILSFARGVAGEPAVIQLKHLVKDVAKLIKATFPASLQIQTQVAGEPHPVKGNATQLHQVLMNLCVNARDAMPQGGVLRLQVENVQLEGKQTRKQSEPVFGPYVRVTVSDTGTGIPAELLDKIFEPFFTTKAEGKGTGLGLPTVQSIVKNHRGFIEVKSEPGRGTQFHIYLPATDVQEAPAATRPAVPIGQGELILVVDDEAAVLEIAKLTLVNHNYQVLIAQDGTQGLGIYQRHRQDIKLVITDLMMPNMDGPALIQALRRIDPQVKVIGASGGSSRVPLTEAAPFDVATILEKPYSTQALLSTVAETLAQGRTP